VFFPGRETAPPHDLYFFLPRCKRPGVTFKNSSNHVITPLSQPRRQGEGPGVRAIPAYARTMFVRASTLVINAFTPRLYLKPWA
jgi:hypothetical protein